MEDPVNEGQAAEATFKGYGKYFDLSATDFVKRIIRSFIPVRPLLGYDEEEDNHKPDLYAPVWIPTTLILSLSVGRSLFLFFQSMVQGSEFQSPGLDFRTLWLSAVIIYSYCIVIPVSLFVFKLCASVDVPFFATLCVYGYSMAPVVAGALVCITPIRIVQISAMGERPKRFSFHLNECCTPFHRIHRNELRKMSPPLLVCFRCQLLSLHHLPVL
mmetsp:Transcript_10742/g.44768  ORF Transcript_10742/g.44768 Transcript_10742/m.44768 type:complete len:215 (-) Transcript_10742:3474-4118(-)